ncbi:PilN domain-containing protein [Herbaspirillum sp. RV1423]|uniref:PilN domain-containing protein n=1 Tax=Herbaspirillum sp. RV1423 TaxID=1443993 RepID=UPI0004B3C178|nr:PilN domain-containing protein [Herbaspirillum sp. RV1423]
MIGINFLPYRAHGQVRLEQRFYLLLAATSTASLALLLALGATLNEQTMLQRQLTQVLQTEHARLDQHIRQGKELREKIAALREQNRRLQALQQQRNDAVRLLAELARQMPRHVYLGAMTQEGKQLTLNGHAPSHRHIMQLLDTLRDPAGPFRHAELREARAAAPVNPIPAKQRHDFVITASHFPATHDAANMDQARQ